MSHAQLSGFDPACFFPQFGVPDEYDTIMGSKAYQHLGDNLRTLPPLKGQSYSRLLMSGIPKHSPFISSIETGPNFDLHHLNVTKDYSSTVYQWPNDGAGNRYTFGHFHNSSQLDMMAYAGYGYSAVIYWADENGEYDSSRSTILAPDRMDTLVFPGESDLFMPFVGHLSSDTVDDAIVALTVFPSRQAHPYVLAHFRGGEQLYQSGKRAMWNDTAQWTGRVGTDSTHRTYGARTQTISADFRGVGRNDCVATDDWGNFFYYRNDPPFNIRTFEQAIERDTLLRYDTYSLYQQPFPLGYSTPVSFLAMQAFPKKNGDRSFDLLSAPSVGSDSESRSGICLFRGGPNFGDKRLYYDSADYLIRHPGYYDFNFVGIQGWPGTGGNLGDLTGTGNNVLVTGGGVLGSGFLAFYVTGTALDDQIDMFSSYLHGAGWYDTIRASSKDIPMFIKSTPWAESSEQSGNGIYETGGVQLLRGASKIPVRENPKWSAVKTPVTDNGHIEVFPNPASKFMNVSFTSASSEQVVFTLYDILGRMVFAEHRMILDGRQTMHLDLPILAAGTYELIVAGAHVSQRSKLVVTQQ
ncbi:MAG: T9SS type A sorting domain-containing protein [Bacteroidetes bacterium]|nr:T9SS type A sorting domain-containing protein [Bacteroidota bacterium]